MMVLQDEIVLVQMVRLMPPEIEAMAIPSVSMGNGKHGIIPIAVEGPMETRILTGHGAGLIRFVITVCGRA